MRPLLPTLLLLLSCSHPRPAPRQVPVRVLCNSGAQSGIGSVEGTSLVRTAAHVLECRDGLPRLSVEAGGVPVSVEAYDGILASLRAEGGTWDVEAPVVRRVGPGDSGLPLYDSAGRLVGYLQAVDGPGGIVTLARDPGLGRVGVRVEGPPGGGLGWEDMECPPGQWPDACD